MKIILRYNHQVATDVLVYNFTMCFANLISCLLTASGVAIPRPQAEALRTTADIITYAQDPSSNYREIALTGCVLQVTILDKSFILKDSVGQISFYTSFPEQPELSRGNIVFVKGHTQLNKYGLPVIKADSVTLVKKAEPPPIPKLKIKDIDPNLHNLLAITTEGTIIDVRVDEIDTSYYYFTLKDGVDTISVTLRRDAGFSQHSIMDACVRITGVYNHSLIGLRRYSAPTISAITTNDIVVLVPPPPDPFDVPSLEQKLFITPSSIAKLGKRKLSGEVLAAWDSNKVMLRTQDGSIANIFLANKNNLPECGTMITAVGYPETDMFRVNLGKAQYRTEGMSDASATNERPLHIDDVFVNEFGTPSINPDAHGKLLALHGTVESTPSLGMLHNRVLLRCGEQTTLLDISANSQIADTLQVGSTLDVIGRCLLECDRWQPDNIFPRIKNIVVTIRKPSDIRIISRPSWWTPERLLAVIGVLLLALAGVYVWNRSLSRLVSRKSRELLREEVAHITSELKSAERTRLAVELHDSISQILAGIAYQLTSSARAIDEDATVARQRIKTAEQMLKSCRTELQHCLSDLRNDMLGETDFATAIRKTLTQLEGDATISVRVNISRSLLHDITAHAILSIVRELVANAIHHGQASSIKIAGCVDSNRLAFSVCDNGKGFDPAHCAGPQQGHFGLMGIRDRLKKLGGTFEIESHPGDQTRATFFIPFADKRPSLDKI